ncbi:MAG: DUF4199 domain-containing protein [Bacteroidota bacterium]
MKKVVRWGVTFGIGLGTILTLIVIVLQAVGENPVGQYEFLFLFPLYVAVMASGLFYFRNYKNQGELYTGQAFLFNLCVNLVAALIYATSVWMIFEQHPETLDLWKSQMRAVVERMDDGRTMDVDVEQGMQTVNATKAIHIAQDKFLKTSIFGLVFGLIVGLAFRRRTVTRREQKGKADGNSGK